MILLVLWAVPPILLLGYVRQAMIARRNPPEFRLSLFESAELDRAIQLLDKVSLRLNELRENRDRSIWSWRALYKYGSDTPGQCDDELRDLKAQTKYLNKTIATLRRRPRERFKLWMHIKGLQFAFVQALVIYAVTLAVMLIFVFQIFAVTTGAMSAANEPLGWYPFDEANAIAVGFSAVAAPLLYAIRRNALRRHHNIEFFIAQELAANETRQPLDPLRAEGDATDESRRAEPVEPGEDNWLTVLGLQKSASVDEVRKTYRTLIKQNHPDRVRDMSPALRKLAEDETKKLNMAYRRALSQVER